MNLAQRCWSIPADTGVVLPAIGGALQGGFYYGQISIGGVTYALIVSPRTGGDITGVVFQDDTAYTFNGNTSTSDGKLIQDNMVAYDIAKFPAQQAVMALSLGGYTDWYIPSKLEMEILYRNLKPTTAVNVTTSGANASAVPSTSNYTSGAPARTSVAAFQATAGANYVTADFYYTATQGPSGTDFSHAKRFTNGADSEDQIYWDYPVRAIRKIAI